MASRVGEMRIRKAEIADVDVLVEMNHQLIRDEGSRNPMGGEELCARMRGWLANGEYEAHLFQIGESLIGYSLHRQADDHIYLRQFFIRREHRSQGLGRTAFEWLAENVWRGSRLRLDVLVQNQAGLAFWKKVGFSEYCITMERGEGTTQE